MSHPAAKPIGPTKVIPSLAVLNAKGATLQGNKLTLVGVDWPTGLMSRGKVLLLNAMPELDVGKIGPQSAQDSRQKEVPQETFRTGANHQGGRCAVSHPGR